MPDRVIETLRRLVRGGDATSGSEYGRKLAEAEDSRQLVEEYLAELDAAAEVQRGGVQAAQQDAGQKNAPAASAGAVAYSIDPNFDREIVAWDKEGRNGRRIFRLGSTGEALQSIGVPDRSIVMVSDKVRTILREHPNVTLDMIRQIPAMLEDPALVLESKGGSILPGTKQNSRIVVAGNVTDASGAPVLCVLDLAPQSAQDRRLGLQDFNKVSSAYAKDVKPAEYLKSSNVLYASPDTNKTQDALNSFGFKFASSELNHLGSMGSITYDGNNVKMQGVPFEEVFGEKNAKNKDQTPVQDAENGQNAQSDEQLREQSRRLGKEIRQLKEERDAWENSEPVRQVRERRAQMKAQMGLFGLKDWDASTPEWQDYLNRRRQYNERNRQLPGGWCRTTRAAATRRSWKRS